MEHPLQVGWITHAPQEVQPTPRSGDEEAAKTRRPIRAGYLGHLILLGNRYELFAVCFCSLFPQSASAVCFCMSCLMSSMTGHIRAGYLGLCNAAWKEVYIVCGLSVHCGQGRCIKETLLHVT